MLFIPGHILKSPKKSQKSLNLTHLHSVHVGWDPRFFKVLFFKLLGESSVQAKLIIAASIKVSNPV